MGDQWWRDDDELLAVLGEALREERDVPAYFVETGKAVFAGCPIEAELAALIYDSLVDALPVPAIRASRATIRELTFATPELKIHVQLTTSALRGQVVPPQCGELEVHMTGRASRTIEIDEQGWFTITPVPRGSFRLLCRMPGGVSALTDWLPV